ncbi:MAG TPA: hypothetical protein VK179_16665 [Bacteroidales bacterium]|nr:hypothetical protein [Bacteroidales bacterium]
MKNSVLNKTGLYVVLSVLLINVSCSVALFPGYRNSTGTEVSDKPQSWFQPDSARFLFNTRVDVMKNHFSGILVVKPIGRDTDRVVMITQMGLKVMDFEFYPSGDMKVYYIMDPMNRKVLIRTLKNDIGMVLMNYNDDSPVKLTEKKTGYPVYKYSQGCKKNYYVLAPGIDKPVKARQIRGLSNKVHATFYGNEVTGIDSVNIEHYTINLSINLNRIIE